MGEEAGRAVIYKFGLFRLDADRQILTKEGTRVDLDAKPIQVLPALLASSGVLVSRKDLLKKVWGGISVSRDSIYQHISVLRKVLGESRNDNKYIITVPHMGYQFVKPVETVRTGPVGPSAQAPTRQNPDEPAPIGTYSSDDGVPYEIAAGDDPSVEDPLFWQLSTSANQVEKNSPSLKKRPDAKRKARRRPR